MPIPLPWFNDGIDPLLPSVIKPSLYFFDEYQTYDLVVGDYISGRILSYLNHKLDDHFISLQYLSINLIDRFTPFSYAWANEYSTYLFSFLKEISYTLHYDNDQLLSGVGYFPDFDNIFGNRFSLLDHIDIAVIPTRLEIRFVPSLSSKIIISSLQRETDFDNYPIDNSIHLFACYSKVYQEYSVSEGIEALIIIDTSKILISSLVVSANDTDLINQVENEIDKLSPWLLYREIDRQFSVILNEITIDYPKKNWFLGTLAVEFGCEYSFNYQELESPKRGQRQGKLNYKFNFDYENSVFYEKPEWFYWASCIYANNNVWGNGEIKQDLGKQIEVEQTWIYLKLKVWTEHSYSTGALIQGNQSIVTSLNSSCASGSQGITETVYHFKDSPRAFLPQTSRARFDTTNYYEGGIYYLLPFDFSVTETSTNFINLSSYWLESPRLSLLPFVHTDSPLILGVNGGISYQVVIFTNSLVRLENASSGSCANVFKKHIWESFNVQKHRLIFEIDCENGIYSHNFRENSSNNSILFTSSHGEAYSCMSSTDLANFPSGVRCSNSSFSDNYSDQGGSIVKFPEISWQDSDTYQFTITISHNQDEPSIIPTLDNIQIQLIDNLRQFSNTEQIRNIMPDSIRVKEIHNALLAQKFGEDDRAANLGYYIERIARILGISVNSDGSVRSIRQSRHIKQGNEIPAGWSIGQWGRNQGGSNEGQKGGSEEEDRDGLAYEVRTNKFTIDPFSGEAKAIEQGGYVLVENLPQLLHIILDDFDKALGMAEAGANVLPSPNNDDPIPYEGINTLLAEIAYMISQLSRNITGTHISSLKNQGMLYELIAAHGVPVNYKKIEVDVGLVDSASLVYPSIDGASNFDMTVWILNQLALLLGSNLNVNEGETP